MSDSVTSVSVKSKITSVTVYESGGQVSRTATVKLCKGRTTVDFEGAPANINKDSVQVGFHIADPNLSPNVCVLQGITFDEREPESNAADEEGSREKTALEKEDLRKRIRALKEEQEDLADRTKLLEEQAATEKTFFDAATTERPKEDPSAYTDLERWKQILETRNADATAAMEHRREVRLRGEQIEEELELLQSKLKKLCGGDGARGARGARNNLFDSDSDEETVFVPHPGQNKKGIASPNPRGARKGFSTTTTEVSMVPIIRIALESTVELPGTEIVVSYLVTAACWKAGYDLRVDRKKPKETNLTYHAFVEQRTDEEWKDVAVTLSTARPTVSGRAPDLQNWYIFPRSTTQAVSKRSRRDGNSTVPFQQNQKRLARVEDEEDSVLSDSDSSDGRALSVAASDTDVAAGAPKPTAPKFEGAAVEEGATSVHFDVPGSHCVAPTGTPIRVSLAKFGLSPEFSLSCRPSVAETVYTYMTAKNSSSYAMIRGDANVFVDGHFTARTTLPRVSPGVAMKVGIGRESGVEVKYRRTEKSDATSQLWGNKKHREYECAMSFKNQTDERKTVKVEHELPTCPDKNVEVKVLTPSASERKHVENEKKDGKVEFEADLKPRDELKLPFRFVVTYPEATTVYGL